MQLAKPTGVLLEDHISHVVEEAAYLAASFPTTLAKYAAMSGGRDLAKWARGVARHHDDGKKARPWQEACQKDYKAWQATGKTQGHLRNADFRHEFASLSHEYWLSGEYEGILNAAIAAHHGKLGNADEDRWRKQGQSKAFWIKLKQISNEELSLPETLRRHYLYAGPRAWLQIADHRASAKEEGKALPELKPFQFQFPHARKRPVQELAEQHWDDEILLLRAPTGSGKTDAALLWAQKQIEARKAERLVIAMPTRFTSNALAMNISGNKPFSDTGIYHSSAWSQFHHRSQEGQQQAKAIHQHARLLLYPVSVCTIDHLLVSLTFSREDHHSIAFSLANSCLVIDEADFYDDWLEANLLFLIRCLRQWQVPVMIMSATLPESFLLKVHRDTGISAKKLSIREDRSDLGRIRCNIVEKRPYENVGELEDLAALCEQQPAIIYANTVDKAKAWFQLFERRNGKEWAEAQLVLYHSRFTNPDKAAIESRLIQMLGREAWTQGKAYGIAILTQIGEMSINISAELMISDLCPVDRLAQRVGRLSRFAGNAGNLYLLEPRKSEALYPAPYGRYLRKTNSWEASPYLIESEKLIQCQPYSAGDFVQLVNQVYSAATAYSTAVQDNVQQLRQRVQNNWLILPAEQPEASEEEAGEWSSRNIGEQVEVLVHDAQREFRDILTFNTYADYEAYGSEFAISIPVYLAKKGLKNGLMRMGQVETRYEKRQVVLVVPSAYTPSKGLEVEEDRFW